MTAEEKYGAPFVRDLFQVTFAQVRRSSPSATPQPLDSPTADYLRIDVNPALHKDPTSALEAMATGDVREIDDGKFIYSSMMALHAPVAVFHVNTSQWHQNEQHKHLDKYFTVQHEVVVQGSWLQHDPAQAEAVVYDLAAVVQHIGPTAHAGHYVAYVKRGGTWYLCKDNIVKTGKPSEVIESSTNKSPHLLYYVEQSSHFSQKIPTFQCFVSKTETRGRED